MILDLITELNIYGAFDRGVPNREHIAIVVNSSVNMAQYGIMLGVSHGYNSAVPIRDNYFWFGEGNLKSGDWIFLFTGPGSPRVTPSRDGLNSVYSVYWNRDMTILHNTNIVPILFRMDGIQTLPPVLALPQIQN